MKREVGANPTRSRHCNGKLFYICHWRFLGRLKTIMNLSQDTYLYKLNNLRIHGV